MLNCIIIKNDDITNIKVRNLTEDSLYKKCGFKTSKDFEKILSIDFNNNFLEVWGKIDKNEKNKSNNIFLDKYNLSTSGKVIIVLKNNINNYISIEKEDFIKFFDLNKELKEKEEKEEEEYQEENKSNVLNNNLENNINQDEEDDNISIDSELTHDAYCYSDED